jgi:hypothetical protein
VREQKSAGTENSFKPKIELSPEEIERRRQRKNARQRRYHARLRKVRLQTPDARLSARLRIRNVGAVTGKNENVISVG